MSSQKEQKLECTNNNANNNDSNTDNCNIDNYASTTATTATCTTAAAAVDGEGVLVSVVVAVPLLSLFPTSSLHIITITTTMGNTDIANVLKMAVTVKIMIRIDNLQNVNRTWLAVKNIFKKP